MACWLRSNPPTRPRTEPVGPVGPHSVYQELAIVNVIVLVVDRSSGYAGHSHGQRVAGSRSITIKVNDPGNTGPLPLPAVGAGPNFAETTNTR